MSTTYVGIRVFHKYDLKYSVFFVVCSKQKSRCVGVSVCESVGEAESVEKCVCA